MDNSPPSSLERQIDSFLEHFKRSASKAMEAEWCSIGVGGIGSTSATSATMAPAPVTATATATAAAANESIMSAASSLSLSQQQQQQQQQHHHLVHARHVTQDNGVGNRPHPLMQRTKSRSSCLELNNLPDSTNVADADSQLFATLCEIDKYNYLFLFEKCKQFNVNGRQLRYMEKDHIRRMIPETHLGILAEFEYLLEKWKVKKGFAKSPNQELETKAIYVDEKPTVLSRGIQTDDNRNQSIGVNTMPIDLPEFTAPSEVLSTEQQELFNALTFNGESVTINCKSPEYINPSKLKCQEHFLLESIIPATLIRTKNNYKNKKLLTEGDRRLMAGSVVNFFESSNIKLTPKVMENLAEQITQHFPTESKKAWYDRHNSKGRGRLYMKFYNSHRSKNSLQHFNNKRRASSTQKSDVMDHTSTSCNMSCSSNDTNTSFLMDEIVVMDQDEGSKMVQSWLKSHKCENFAEILEMWQDTLHYRLTQLKNINNIDDVKSFLEDWPSYKLERGFELLTLDFEKQNPKSMNLFRTRWLVYQQSIVNLFEAEVKDSSCLLLLDQYKTNLETLNEDSNCCLLFYLLHAITKPYRVFKTATGSVRYCISDSQHSVTRLIQHKSEMDDYQEPHPCIFVVGERLFDITECYVCFLDIRYKLSFIDCLVACMQLFTLFKIEDPLPSLHFWQFVRGYLFDIHKEKERPYAIMENVIQYLETSAKRKIE